MVGEVRGISVVGIKIFLINRLLNVSDIINLFVYVCMFLCW